MIKNYIKTPDIDIEILSTVDSTNDYLKQMAIKGASDGTIVIANEQTKGKGSKGRSFISLNGGIYLSVLIRPDFENFDATVITSLTSVAVSNAIEEICGKTTVIKWVNDVLLQNKKVCGILCESAFSNNNKPEFVVVGIGINFNKPKEDFPDEIKDIATYLYIEENEVIKEKLTAKVIDNFFEIYNSLPKKDFLEVYRSRNCVLNKKVKVIKNGLIQSATALSIDDECRLLVKYDDGNEELLSSAEISIKLKEL